MNGECQLPEDKIMQCEEVFDLFDKNKDGSITTNELGDVLRALGANPSRENLQEMIDEMDEDGSGKIEFREFLNIFAKKMKEPETEDDFIEAFKIFDTDGNGLISGKELKQVMNTLGEDLTDEEADDLIRDNDMDNDGYINYHEFVRIMMIK